VPTNAALCPKRPGGPEGSGSHELVERTNAHRSPSSFPPARPPKRNAIVPAAFAVNEWWLRARGPLAASGAHAVVRGADSVGDGVGVPDPLGEPVGATRGFVLEHAAATPNVASDASRKNARRSCRGSGTPRV